MAGRFGHGYRVGYARRASPGRGFSALAQALFNRMTVPPPNALKIKYDNFLTTVVGAGLDLKLDGIWLYKKVHHEQASRINVLVPSQGLSVALNSPVFNTSTGWTNTVTGGIKLPLNWNTLGKLTLNSQTMGVKIGGGTDAQAVEYAMGQETGSVICGIRPRDSTGQFAAFVGTNVVTNFLLNPSIVGHYTVCRLGAGLLKAYKNNIYTGSQPTTASASLSASQIMIGGHNGNGNDFQLELAYLGAALNDADVDTLHNAILAFQA